VSNTKILKDIVTSLATTLRRKEKSNKGADFKINTDAKWKETLGIRCNHITMPTVPSYIQQMVVLLTQHRRLSWWERSSIARCYEYERLNGRRIPLFERKTIYFTLKLPKPLYARLRNEWPDDTYRDLKVLVEWLEKQEETQ
jgi:hypothetical protein